MRGLVRSVVMARHVRDYAVRTVLATHPDSEHAPESVRRFVRHGASPRGVQSLVLAAKAQALFNERLNVSFEDIQHAAAAALRHRILLNFEGEAQGVATTALIEEILGELEVAPA